jgi:hypothetical protein
MAVDASHIAFLDLGPDARPTLVEDHAADIRQLGLGISMVEFENDDVVDTAINTGMRREVGQDFASILHAPRVQLGDSPPDVVRLVRQVVGMPIRRVALSTVGIQRAAGLVGE